MMLAMGLSYLAFILLEYIPSIPILLRIYYHKGMLNFIKIFLSASGEVTIWILSFILLMCYHTDLWMLNHPCIPEVKPIWSWCVIFVIIISFTLLLFRSGFLHLCSSYILTCSFLFVCVVLVWSQYLGSVGHWKWVKKHSFLFLCREFVTKLK